ncbi:allantoate amidohydrolase [Echinimonas agarilytica]|uniref:Allantoate amidohydrolase n=1 Tax=Echinimonas agarilytica TaxID=1215918 RepID=A0AA41W880_9GAMM|nr:allantoate amidohydrolase [Echinimonas agarilytica]MCM2680238.1 allantoate amidohydrolase [Echinimonas agarilytica]
MDLSTALHSQAMAQQIMQWCDQLAQISAKPNGIHRFYLTPEHKACNQQVAKWMEQAGMTAFEDAAGNLVGRLTSAVPNAKTLMIGSHLDTIPNAGRYDGILGVLLPIAAIRQLNSLGIELPYHIDVLGFGDEEGIRFGSTLLGSRAVAGTWQSDWWQLEDTNGVTMAEAFESFGLEPDSIGKAAYLPQQLIGYLEVHIEQGPVLEQQQLAVGIVSAIAGARRFQIHFEGFAGHAGTVPMTMRQDALVAAAEAICQIEAMAKTAGIVATVGHIECRPNAVNVIPGSVRFSLDIRSVDDHQRDSTLDSIEQQLDEICAKRNLKWHWHSIHDAAAVHCAPWLMEQQQQTLEALEQEPLCLMSGAGHDAMALAEITDIAMYFVRCKGGISHHPDESITKEDVVVALDTLRTALVQFSQQERFSQVL